MPDVKIKIKLTPFQAREAALGLGEDHEQGRSAWGRLDWDSSKPAGRRGAVLHITDVDGAVFRLSALRDLYYENSQTDRAYQPGTRSLTGLVVQIVALSQAEASGEVSEVSR
jgi:hypothetical protein